MSNLSGVLYVIATPIGNLQDISARAIEKLNEVDLILAEDTRYSKRLLEHFGIKAVMHSCHEYNERESVPYLLDLIQQGKSIALISDAGTPLISDPGFQLVKSAHERNIRIVPVPGPSALITALSIAGIAVDKFIFEGFLPEKDQARRKRMEMLADETRTMVFYEAPHRILEFLDDASRIFGTERTVCLCRELTKKFETIKRDSLENLLAFIRSDSLQQKGEFVVIIAGRENRMDTENNEFSRIINILLKHDITIKQASAIVAEITGGRKNKIYKLALELSKSTMA